jgi:hypothetical protein
MLSPLSSPFSTQSHPKAMNQRERIASLLSQGLPATSVATIVGLSPARISQIQKEPEFELLLASARAEIEEKDTEETALGAKYLEAEHFLLKQVMELAPVAELRDVTAALRVVSERQEKAKNRISPVHQGSLTLNNIVQLQIPQHATPELHFSAQKEVIAIENRNLAPLSSTGVLSLFAQLPKPNAGDIHESLSDTPEAERSSPEALPAPADTSAKPLISSAKLADGARKFLDSLHPAPFAGSF